MYFASPFVFGGRSGQGDLLLAFLTSGILLSILFLLQDTGKTPLRVWGKITYAIIAGMLAFLIVGPGTSPAGAVFVVLIMNVVSPVIQNLEHYLEMKHTKIELMEKVKEFREGLDA
jgi:electron transport complex protein RnfD